MPTFSRRDDTPRPVGLSFVQKNGHWYLKLTCASGMEIVLDGAGGKFNFDDFVGKGRPGSPCWGGQRHRGLYLYQPISCKT